MSQSYASTKVRHGLLLELAGPFSMIDATGSLRYATAISAGHCAITAALHRIDHPIGLLHSRLPVHDVSSGIVTPARLRNGS